MKLFQYRLPMKNGTFRDGIIVQNGDRLGDIAPLPGFSRESFQEAKDEAVRVVRTGGTPTLPSVRFGFECAEEPFPLSLQLQIGAFLEHKPGFRTVKLKIGHLGLAEALLLVKKIPKHIGLRPDFNRSWPLSKLLDFAAHFSPDDFEYLEEPTREFTDLLEFSRITNMPIAVDESVPEVPYWEIPTLKAVIVKPTVLGQMPFKPPHADMIFTSAYESGIGMLHIARLAQQYGGPHGLDPYSQLMEDLIVPRPIFEQGYLSWQRTAPPTLNHPSLCPL